MSNIWDFVNDITFDKKDLFKNSENIKLTEKIYESFLVNRALSYHPDCIIPANEMNINGHIDKKLQHSYLLNTIRPRKRFSKWAKSKESEYFEYVQMYYKSSRGETKTLLSILTDEQLAYIKDQFVSPPEKIKKNK